MAVSFWAVTILTLAAVIGESSAQVAIIGNCPDIPAFSPFDVSRYVGQWYEIERYFTPFSVGAVCVGARYTDLANGSVEVYNTQNDGITGNFSSMTGTARPLDPNSPDAKLLVNFPAIGNFDAPYWVMDTDYSDYSIVWSCRNSGPNSLQTIWFLSRTRTTTERTRGYVYGFVNGLRLNTNLFMQTNQTSCPPLP